MPDPRRLYRRITESNLPTRVIAHISVVSLVAVASLAGLSQTQAPGTADADSDFLALVQSVRGAAEGARATQDAFGDTTLCVPENLLADGAIPVALRVTGRRSDFGFWPERYELPTADGPVRKAAPLKDVGL